MKATQTTLESQNAALLDALTTLKNSFIHTEGNTKGNKAKTAIITLNPDVQDALNKANQILIWGNYPESKPAPVIVFVGGGCVTDVMGADGKAYECHSVVDYDNEEEGNCPVCGQEFDTFPEHICESCGYDEDKSNALECAVALLKKG